MRDFPAISQTCQKNFNKVYSGGKGCPAGRHNPIRADQCSGPAGASAGLRIPLPTSEPSGEPTIPGPLTFSLSAPRGYPGARGLFAVSCFDLEKGGRSPAIRSGRMTRRRARHERNVKGLMTHYTSESSLSSLTPESHQVSDPGTGLPVPLCSHRNLS